MTTNQLLRMISDATDRALALVNHGDQPTMILKGDSDPWFTGDNEDVSASLVVPGGDDMIVDGINIYLSARRFDQSDPIGTGTDLTYRPAYWVSVQNRQDVATSGVPVQDANATWKMSDTYNGSYQGDTALQIVTAYSSTYGQGPVRFQAPLTAWIGRRTFFFPRRIKRGSTVTIEIQPTFSRVSTTTIKTQFRVTVELTGHKEVRRAA